MNGVREEGREGLFQSAPGRKIKEEEERNDLSMNRDPCPRVKTEEPNPLPESTIKKKDREWDEYEKEIKFQPHQNSIIEQMKQDLGLPEFPCTVPTNALFGTLKSEIKIDENDNQGWSYDGMNKGIDMFELSFEPTRPLIKSEMKIEYDDGGQGNEIKIEYDDQAPSGSRESSDEKHEGIAPLMESHRCKICGELVDRDRLEGHIMRVTRSHDPFFIPSLCRPRHEIFCCRYSDFITTNARVLRAHYLAAHGQRPRYIGADRLHAIRKSYASSAVGLFFPTLALLPPPLPPPPVSVAPATRALVVGAFMARERSAQAPIGSAEARTAPDQDLNSSAQAPIRSAEARTAPDQDLNVSARAPIRLDEARSIPDQAQNVSARGPIRLDEAPIRLDEAPSIPDQAENLSARAPTRLAVMHWMCPQIEVDGYFEIHEDCHSATRQECKKCGRIVFSRANSMYPFVAHAKHHCTVKQYICSTADCGYAVCERWMAFKHMRKVHQSEESPYMTNMRSLVGKWKTSFEECFPTLRERSRNIRFVPRKWL